MAKISSTKPKKKPPVKAAISQLKYDVGVFTKGLSATLKGEDFKDPNPEKTAKSKAAHEKAHSSKDDRRPAGKPGPTRAQLKAAAKKRYRAEAQARRKKFEKEKGERVAAMKKKRAKLLNLA